MSTVRHGRLSVLPWALAASLLLAPKLAPAQSTSTGSIIQNISAPSERVDLYVHTSKLLRLQKPIPKAVVQNPDIVDLVPRGPAELQVIAKKEGFTTITLWDTENRTYAIDVLVGKDGRELSTRLKQHFPNASLTVHPLMNKVVVTGVVNDPAHIGQIVDIAKDYYPEVINRVTVGGVQQVLLHVKIMEVSRTKLRRLGVDWAYLNTNVPVQSVAGLLAASGVGTTLVTSGAETFKFGLIAYGSPFHAVVEALRQNNLAKVLAEPNLVTVSGRPAFFNSGGEFPILVPQSLGTVSIEYKKFGTQVDFLPIVLRDGHIRLEVRPRVSEIDPARSVTVGGMTVPGLRTREVDTGVELRAGQTLAIAGLVQTRTEAESRGIPWLMDLPYVGVPFRRVENEENEIELLVMVTPELVQGMEHCEVPPGGPGLFTQCPDDCELGFKAYLEVPKCCGPECGGPECGGALEPGMMGGPGGPIEGEMVPPPGAGRVVPMAPPMTPGAPGAAKPAPQGDPAPPNTTRRTVPAQPTAAAAPRSATRPNRQNGYTPSTPNSRGPAAATSTVPGLIGPQGYDVRN
jgi:pilus assembly protein CpaC